MSTVSRIPALIIAAFALTSCLQNSTIFQVKPDGSGAIIDRYFFSPQMVAMKGALAGGLGGIFGTATPEGLEGGEVDPQKIFNPTREDLEKDAACYGEGVRYSKHEATKNAQGWEGYLVVYEFDDINKVKSDPDNQPSPLKELENLSPGGDAEAKLNLSKAKENLSEDSVIAFTMTDGLLIVNTGVCLDSVGKIAETGGVGDVVGPDGQIRPEAAAQWQMAAGLMQGLRMAAFLQIDGEIAETDALHVNGNLITLMDTEMAKMTADPKFLEFLKQALSVGEDPDEATVQSLINSLAAVDGVTMQTQEKITVKIK